jgi:PGF-pre-PGF domain-containing protein
VDIDFDMRRDGRCYFNINSELEAHRRILPATTLPVWVVAMMAAPVIPPEVIEEWEPWMLGGAAGALVVIAVAVYYVTTAPVYTPAVGETYAASENPPNPIGINPITISMDGNVSFELTSPVPGEFKLDVSGQVTIPDEALPQVQMAVAGFKATPDFVNASLLQEGRRKIEEIRQQLPPQFSDLWLEELRIINLDLRDSLLSFSLTATVSSRMFEKEEIFKEIERSAWDAKTIQRLKTGVEEFFKSLPLGADITFSLSSVNGRVSLDLDAQAFSKGEKVGALTLLASVVDKEISLNLDAQALKEGENVGTLTISFEFSEERKFLSFELTGRGFEDGVKISQTTITLKASSPAPEVFSAEFDAEAIKRGETLARIDAKLESSGEGTEFYLDLYSPKVSCTLEALGVENRLDIDMNGWFELPKVGGLVQWRSFLLENMLRSYAEIHIATEEERAQVLATLSALENELLKILRDVNTSLSLKVLPDTKLIGLPAGYRLADNVYEWTGTAANDALIHLLMGRLREIEYTPGLSKSVPEAPAGQPTSIDLGEELVVSEIIITPKETITDFSVAVTHVEKPPEISPPPEIVHIYFQTDVPELVEEGEIRFRVEKTWMQQNNISRENVRLLGYEEDRKEWTPLPVEIIDEDENYLYCSAKTTKFALFAVASPPAVELVTPKREPPFDSILLLGIGAVSCGAILAIIFGIRRRKFRRGRARIYKYKIE